MESSHQGAPSCPSVPGCTSLVMSHSHCPLWMVEKSMLGTLLRSWTLERKDNHPGPGGSLSTPQTALSLLSFCVGSHKSAERQEGHTQRLVWRSGQPGSRARAWRAGVGCGIKPQPCVASDSQAQTREGLPWLTQPRTCTKGAKSFGKVDWQSVMVRRF